MVTFKSSVVLGLVLLSCTMGCVVGVRSKKQAVMYLSRYGYLSPSMKNFDIVNIPEDTMVRAIKDLQSFSGLPVTGRLDDVTLQFMEKPRCAVQDKVWSAPNSRIRSKRYDKQVSQWRNKKELTYKISVYTEQLYTSETDSEIRRAFDVWSKVIPLKFIQKQSGEVDIDISFKTIEHDGVIQTNGYFMELAHSYPPALRSQVPEAIDGDIHFNDKVIWTINITDAIDFFQVATHEIGHSLGLSHSDVKSSVMFPTYKNYDPNFALDKDDEAAAEELYGSEKSNESWEQEGSSLCKDSKIDTIFNLGGETFVFKGNNYWKLSKDGLEQGYPKLIADTFTGVPGDIDAVFSHKNTTVFFKGNKMWISNSTVFFESPKNLGDIFPGVPDGFDTIVDWHDELYFFKGSQYWKCTNFKSCTKYPQDIKKNWPGIPDNINAAFNENNEKLYFFKDDSFYIFKKDENQLEINSPMIPFDTGYHWFGCNDINTWKLKKVAVKDPHLNSFCSCLINIVIEGLKSIIKSS